MNKLIKYKLNNNVATICLGNSPVNALSEKFVQIIHETILEIKSNPEVKILIAYSDQKHFCAGADLKERLIFNKSDTSLKILNKINLCFDALESLEIPTICVMHGAALGGGAELSLCFDFRISSSDLIFGFPETNLGIIPGAGGTQRLSRLIGLSKAKYLILSTEKISLNKAYEFGIVDFKANSFNEAMDIADKISEKICLNSHLSVKSAKRAIVKGYDLDLEEGKKIELSEYKKNLDNPDRIKALEKFNK